MKLRKKIEIAALSEEHITTSPYHYCKGIIHRNSARESNCYEEYKKYFPFAKRVCPFDNVPNLYKKGYVNFLQISNVRNNRVWNVPIPELADSHRKRSKVLEMSFVLWLCQKNVINQALKNVPCTYFLTQKILKGGNIVHRGDKVMIRPYNVRYIPLRHFDISCFEDWINCLNSINPKYGGYTYEKFISLEFQLCGIGGEQGYQEHLFSEKLFERLLEVEVPSPEFWEIIQKIHDEDKLNKFHRKDVLPVFQQRIYLLVNNYKRSELNVLKSPV